MIVGGESGGPARPPHPDHLRSLRDQCATAGVPFFFKQWGEWLPQDHLESALCRATESGTPVPARRQGYKGHKHPDGTLMLRLGTAHAGHLLDTHEHHAFPPSASSI